MKRLIVVIFCLTISVATKCQNVFGFQYKIAEIKEVVVIKAHKNRPADKCGLKTSENNNNKLKYSRDKEFTCAINKVPLKPFELSCLSGNCNNGECESQSVLEYTSKGSCKNGKVEKSTEANAAAETQNPSGDYQQSLAELNAFIQSAFDKTFEVKGKKIINYFKGGKAEANIADLYKVVKLPKYNYVYLICKDDNKCVYSSYTKYNHSEFTFQCENEANMDKTFDLLSNFWFQLTGIDSRIKFTNSELLNIQNIENKQVVLLEVDKSEPAYSSLKKMLNKTVKASYLFMNYDFESYNGRIIIDDKNSYTVKKIKVALASPEILEQTQDKGTSMDSDKYKSNIDVSNSNTEQKNNEKVNDGVAEFKSGDRVVIQIGLLDNHFVENGKSKYDGETGVVVELEFDDAFGTYFGKIKMDSDKEVVEFNDIGVELAAQTNNSVQQNTLNDDNYIFISEEEFVVREFKKGDKVLVQINSFDDHFRMRGKSLYNGETGTVVELEYSDLDNSYHGKIKMDSDKKVVEFNDIWVKLVM